MVSQLSLLVTLVQSVDRLPVSATPSKRRGRSCFYPDRLFLKALLIMIVKQLYTVHELLGVLEQPTQEMAALRALLLVDGRFPSRRTWERRLQALPAALPAQIGCLGRYLVERLAPWEECGRAVAVDSTALAACGGVWHKKHQEAGIVPHSSIDTQAGWTHSGWHGWVYGWKLHLAVTVAAVWIPLAARLTPADEADNKVAPLLILELPGEARFLLGDQAYGAANVQAVCEQSGRLLVTPRRGSYPHRDSGVEVRRLFHQLRRQTIENFNEQIKGIFDLHRSVPTKGETKTARWVLGAVFAYQVTLLYRFEQNEPLRVGLKPLLKAA
jgi:Transposase DDE domain